MNSIIQITKKSEQIYEDEKLGPIDYIVSRRSNITMISISTNKYLVLISAQRDANAQDIIRQVNSAFTHLPDIKP